MKPKLTLLYDGSCPLCAWEHRNLASRDRKGHLAFINIQAPDFDPQKYDVTKEALLARMHGITPDGHMLVGAETLIASYRAVGWWWVYLPLRILPRCLVERGYNWFAAHRHVISRWAGRFFGLSCETGMCRRD